MKVAMLGTGAIAPVALATMKAGIRVEAPLVPAKTACAGRNPWPGSMGFPAYTDCRALFREADVDTAYIAW